MIIRECKEVTPIEKLRNNIFVKRDDLYSPYEDIGIYGEKIRTYREIVEKNLRFIKEECGGNIALSTAVSSVESLIAARVSKEYGVKALVFVGSNRNAVCQNRILKRAFDFGAEIVICEANFPNVIKSRMREVQDKRGSFIIENTYKPEWVGCQIKNIRDDIRNVLVKDDAGLMVGILKECNTRLKGIERFVYVGRERDLVKACIGEDVRTDKIDVRSVVSLDVIRNLRGKILIWNTECGIRRG